MLLCDHPDLEPGSAGTRQVLETPAAVIDDHDLKLIARHVQITDRLDESPELLGTAVCWYDDGETDHASQTLRGGTNAGGMARVSRDTKGTKHANFLMCPSLADAELTPGDQRS